MVLLLLLLLPGGPVACVALARYGFGRLGHPGAGPADGGGRLRGTAALLGAAAVAVYVWGLLHVAGAVLAAEDGGTDSAPVRPCRTPGWQEWARDPGITGYTVSYLPLRFVCETGDGGRYATGHVPRYVNPAFLCLTVAAVATAGSAALDAERRARRRTVV
ncbi:hypothetical protein GFH48_12395 [Streptomyces fagopyri]|uniref:Uncharacterized protein n=1 Tax=Streptomyces fagopyri TaxID=2662397 RepID=A0A5Q0LA85_9ACTN|nr:hypothetical protein [Streptomyces fagopyri]QFZ73940.1 hypothetical protein GFH48_12395 [Streptomyces fagopyri]